jgi:hypothetical protein
LERKTGSTTAKAIFFRPSLSPAQDNHLFATNFNPKFFTPPNHLQWLPLLYVERPPQEPLCCSPQWTVSMDLDHLEHSGLLDIEKSIW